VRGAALLAGLVILLVAVQYALPGRALYHAGWYNLVLVGLGVWVLFVVRRDVPAVASPRARAGIWLFALGIAIVAFAGAADGLLGPDPHTVVGAPGASVPDADAGTTLAFPPLDRANDMPPVRWTATALIEAVPRTVVAIDARDARGGHLTVTQPSGSAFLSPVLLMQQTQAIGDDVLPYDSFALPGVHRIVKAVLFSRAQAASLPALAWAHQPVVLFDLEDETGASLPHAIGFAANGKTATIGGLRLTPHIVAYPAIRLVPIPDLEVVLVGAAALLIGLFLTLAPNRATMPQR
jgi:hypothetical protein